MKALPEDFHNSWKTYLQIGNRILQEESTAGQYRLICETIKEQLNAEARMWFSERYYPLPGDMEIPLLVEQAVPDFVWRHWQYLLAPAADEAGEKNQILILENTGNGSNAVIPFKYQKNFLGLLHLSRGTKKPFTAGEIEFLDGFLSHAAIALETSRLNVLKKWRHDQLSLVRKVSAKISSITDLDNLFQQITDEVQATFAYPLVAIYTPGRNESGLHVRAYSACDPQQIPPQLFPAKTTSGIASLAAAKGEEILAQDAGPTVGGGIPEVLPGTLSHLALPMKTESGVLGVLEIENSQPLGINENDLQVLRMLAYSVALAIEQASLFDNLQRRAGQIGAVVEVGNVISSILDFDELMNEIVRIIQNRFGYPFVHIFTVKPADGQVVFEAGIGSRSASLRGKELAYHIDDPVGIIPWVARSNKTMLVNDVSREPLYRPSELFPKDTHSELAVPLSFGGKVLGVLDIQSDRLNAFDDNDRFLFEALGATVAIAIRNAGLYRTEQWRRSLADAFRDVAELINANVELDRLLNEILDKLETYLPCDASAIWLLDQNENLKDIPTLKLAAAHCVDPRLMNAALNQSVEARRWLENAALISEATIRSPREAFCPLGVALAYPPDYSSIAAPLQAGDTPLGILTLAHEKPGRYNLEARAMTTTFASYAAVAIQNSRLFREAQEQAWISSLLLRIAETVQSVDSVPGLFEQMAKLVPLLVEVKNCAFFRLDEKGKNVILENTYGDVTAARGTVFPLAETPVFQHLAADQRHKEPVAQPLPGFARGPQETSLLFPLSGRGRILGAFYVTLQNPFFGGAETPGDQQTMAILLGIVNQVSVALENLDLIETSQQEAYVTAALLQVARAVVSQSDIADIMTTIVELIPILVGAETCLIYLWDENRRLFHPGQVSTGGQALDESILVENFKPGEFKLLDAVRKQDRIVHCPIPEGINSPRGWKKLSCIAYEPDDEVFLSKNKNWLIGLPLSVKGEVYGVLLVQDKSGRPFHEKRLEILTGIAQQTALSIQNDLLNREIVDRERLDSEFQLALQVQRTFLPDKLPEIPGWDMDVRWQPARQVGGDFYDVFDMGDGQLGLVIADVSDKGIPAALYMTVTRTLIRASLRTCRTPAEVLQTVNDSLVMESLNGMFVTAFFAILSVHTGKLVYANAGHNRPMILRQAQRRIDILEKGGMALGITHEFRLENRQVTLRDDDTLLLFTDGVTESFSPSGEAFGEEHLRTALRAACCSTTGELLTAIEKAASDFRAGLAPTDDMTMVGVKRLRQKSKRLFGK